MLALNLAVFSAVQSGLTLAVRKYRGTGTDDISTNMIGMFGAGGALSLCTNLVGDQPAAPGQTKPTTPGASPPTPFARGRCSPRSTARS